MGRGEQHGEAGDDGKQGVDNQTEAVNHLLLLLLVVHSVPKKMFYFVGLYPSKVEHFFWDTV